MFPIAIDLSKVTGQIPFRIQTAITTLMVLGHIENGSGDKPGRELAGPEVLLHKQACETLRLYIAGEIDLEKPPAPDRDTVTDTQCDCIVCQARRQSEREYQQRQAGKINLAPAETPAENDGHEEAQKAQE